MQDLKRKLILKRWSSMCVPWLEGGFNIKEVLAWNYALLSKWIWRLAQNQEGIWSNWTRHYCLANSSIWDATHKDHYAESFRSILRVRDIWIDRKGSHAQASLNSCIVNGKFNTGKAYDLLRMKMPKLRWTHSIAGVEIMVVFL